MRHLTVTRIKSAASATSTMNVYVEDTAGSVRINGELCRLLGTLKNGEQKTFDVTDSAAKVYVIAEKRNQSVSREFYQLPEGNEDVALFGKNEFNSASGNAFRFNNGNGPEPVKIMNPARVKIVSAIVVALSLFLVFIIGSKSAYIFGMFEDDHAYSIEEMSITMPQGFNKKMRQYPYLAIYTYKDLELTVTKYSHDDYSHLQQLTAEEYLKRLTGKTNEFGDDGLVGYESEKTNDKKESYTLYAYLDKSDTGFWLVEFYVPEDRVEEYDAKVSEWAKSVTFAEQSAS